MSEAASGRKPRDDCEEEHGENAEASHGRAAQVLILVLSCMVIATVAGALTVERLHGKDPAHVEVRVVAVTGPPWTVEVEVHNGGDRAAQDVSIHAALRHGNESVLLQFQFLPAHDTQRHQLHFDGDPTGGLIFTIAYTGR
jgi:uncharacterized protein (TIGR02588 family)